MQDLAVTEEQDALGTLTEEHDDVDGDGRDDTSSLDDDDLPQWAYIA